MTVVLVWARFWGNVCKWLAESRLEECHNGWPGSEAAAVVLERSLPLRGHETAIEMGWLPVAGAGFVSHSGIPERQEERVHQPGGEETAERAADRANEIGRGTPMTTSWRNERRSGGTPESTSFGTIRWFFLQPHG